jgi:hypothetical protein
VSEEIIKVDGSHEIIIIPKSSNPKILWLLPLPRTPPQLALCLSLRLPTLLLAFRLLQYNEMNEKKRIFKMTTYHLPTNTQLILLPHPESAHLTTFKKYYPPGNHKIISIKVYLLSFSGSPPITTPPLLLLLCYIPTTIFRE